MSFPLLRRMNIEISPLLIAIDRSILPPLASYYHVLPLNRKIISSSRLRRINIAINRSVLPHTCEISCSLFLSPRLQKLLEALLAPTHFLLIPVNAARSCSSSICHNLEEKLTKISSLIALCFAALKGFHQCSPHRDHSILIPLRVW